MFVSQFINISEKLIKSEYISKRFSVKKKKKCVYEEHKIRCSFHKPFEIFFRNVKSGLYSVVMVELIMYRLSYVL